MPRPVGWKKPAGAMEPHQLRLPVELWDRLVKLVPERGRAAYIRQALEEKLERDELKLRVDALEARLEGERPE